MVRLTSEITIFAGSAPSKKPTFGLQIRVKIYVFSACFWKRYFFKFLYQKYNFWAPTWAPTWGQLRIIFKTFSYQEPKKPDRGSCLETQKIYVFDPKLGPKLEPKNYMFGLKN